MVVAGQERVIWASGKDPNLTREKLRDSVDSEHKHMKALLEILSQKGELTSDQIHKLAHETTDEGQVVRAALLKIRVRFDIPRSLGMNLRKYVDRTFGDFCLRNRPALPRLTYWCGGGVSDLLMLLGWY